MDNGSNKAELSPEDVKNKKAEQAGQDVAELGAKAAGAYFGGQLGAKAADMATKTKTGKAITGAVGKQLASTPLNKQLLSSAQPMIEKAKPMADAAINQGIGGSKGLDAKDGLNSGNIPKKDSSQNQNDSSQNENDSSQNQGAGGFISDNSKKSLKLLIIFGPAILFILIIIVICSLIFFPMLALVENLEKWGTSMGANKDSFTEMVYLSDSWEEYKDYYVHMQCEADFYSSGAYENCKKYAENKSLLDWFNKDAKSYYGTIDSRTIQYISNSGLGGRMCNGDYLDIPLIMSTFHYEKMMDSEAFPELEGVEQKEQNWWQKLWGNFRNLLGIKKENVPNFYEISDEEIGNSITLNSEYRKLLGALVTDIYTTQCKEVKCENYVKFENMAPLEGATSNLNLWDKKAYAIALNIRDNKQKNEIYSSNFQSVISNWENETNSYTFFDFMNFSDSLEDCDSHTSTSDCPTPPPGEKKICDCKGNDTSSKYYISEAQYCSINDYEKYKKYLRNHFVIENYITCETCKYASTWNQKTDVEKEEIIEKIINEIFYSRDAFADLINFNTEKIGGGTHVVEGVTYQCTNGQTPNLGTYPGHGGIDVNGVPLGTYVYPLYEGEVVKINRYSNNLYPHMTASGGYACGSPGYNDFGNMVVIRGIAADGKQYDTIYAHLNDILVNVGDKVFVNTKIGKVGNTGCSTGAHLHIEMRKQFDSKIGRVIANSIYTNDTVAGTLCSREVKE